MGAQERDTRKMNRLTAACLIIMTTLCIAQAEQWEEIAQRWPDGKPWMVNTLDGDGRDGIGHGISHL